MATQDTNQNQNRGMGQGAGAQHNDEAVIRKFFSVLNEHDVNKMLALVSPDCTIMSIPLNKTYQGHSGFREYMQNWITAFPDYKLDITNIISSNERASVEFVARATHKGNFQLPSGNVQPSNKRVELKFADVHELRGGLISKLRSYYDSTTMMTQLGIMPKI
jgi:steroid delta-isomerase-like uncharacterized protein